MMSHSFILFLLCCDWYHPLPPSRGTIGALAFRPNVAVREQKHTSCTNGGTSLMHRQQQQQQQQNQQQQQSNTNVAGVLGRKVAPLCSSIRNEQQVNGKNDDDESPLSIDCIDCDTLTSSVELPSGGMVSNEEEGEDETLTKASNAASTITLDNQNEGTDTAIIRAKTLDGRLLCATQCAYGFDTAAPDGASDFGVYFRGASYVAGTTAKRISRGVNSAFVGRTVDGIVIAFRGTQPSSPLDWLQNAAIFLSKIKIKSSKSNTMIDIPGLIHSGYYQAVKSLWKPVTNEVKALLKDQHDNNNVYITGHSKGGAMASIAAILFQLDESLPVNVTQVCTFGSIKVGDSSFRDAYNRLVNQTSYENHLDIIPFLPPSSNSFMEEMVDDADMVNMLDGMLWSREYKQKKNKYAWDYQTVGRRRYIDKTGKVIKIDNNKSNQPGSSSYRKDLDRMRIQEIEKKTLLSVKEFLAGHCSTCPDPENNCDGGYFHAISDEVCQQKTDGVQDS
mmetsp:Transcript_14819/g.21897  ORF Transcript_14819/g.21897 Transcript_14819/m.21897 type:complete len:504 (-) Transcript_14819:201-1712(-)|eukprot:CAMPEP_0195527666 /NCGR_PEP_ID=MMETSP0794_2-20130614/29517_1 /TAXON_ID=515487 /ORGANISM="Stephanopyxis turris, Strain CCMP 815" /LENGTH=503 /DNA_ID=CAMNT_0040658637 /DNA_START=69 /DNA_END=1580 /DNA_ORIENTATION=+